MFLTSLLSLTLSQDVNEVDNDLEREKKQERLRWFPADTDADCDEEPGAEQGLHIQVTFYYTTMFIDILSVLSRKLRVCTYVCIHRISEDSSVNECHKHVN